MKKIIVLAICLLASISYSSAQKIKVDELDPFLKLRNVCTSFEKICDNTSGQLIMGNWDRRILLAIENRGGNEIIRLKWCVSDGAIIEKDALVLFLGKDGSVYTFKNKERSFSKRGAGVVGFRGSAYLGIDMRIVGKLEDLVDKDLVAVRIYTTDGYVDFKTVKNCKKVISKLYKLYSKTITKSNNEKE